MRLRLVVSALGLGLLAARPALADHQIEVGGFAGVHVFSDNNELGVVDTPNAASLENSVAFGIRGGFHFTRLLGVEAELSLTPTNVRIVDVDVLQIGWRVHAILECPHGLIRPFAVAGLGESTASSNDATVFANDTDLLTYLGGGARWQAAAGFGVRADARVLFPPSSASEGPTTDWELTLGVFKTFGAGGAKVATTAPVEVDGDADGVVGAADHCATEPEDVDGFEDDDGCPDPDNDQDGVLDGADKCPDQAETRNGYQDDDGCPDEEPDLDGDGLKGAADHCPEQAEDKDGFQDDDGCPDPDNDADGVADASDKCPDKLETQNGFEDGDGCPDVVPPELTAITGVIKGISFGKGNDVLSAGSKKPLDAIAKVLGKNADLRVEISGHTDNTGDHDVSVGFSLKRAEAVKAYLVAKGIAAERVTAVGVGPDRPVADNALPAGRTQNNRIELRLIPAAESAAPAPVTP